MLVSLISVLFEYLIVIQIGVFVSCEDFEDTNKIKK